MAWSKATSIAGKVLKRQISGRAGFQLLRARVLNHFSFTPGGRVGQFYIGVIKTVIARFALRQLVGGKLV
ncbi:hypothetical protein, partial [Paraburkholderia sp. GAS32]|uniref:hypothetical protein n=1 Tax=Paraburkholderia sp. GAS32 TaxID=3035129 RepID=UPI003D22A823